MQKVSFKTTETWLPAKESWLSGSIGGMTSVAILCFLFLCAITIFQTARFKNKTRKDVGTQKAGKRRREKQELGFRGQEDVDKSTCWYTKSGAEGQPVAQENFGCSRVTRLGQYL
jgi:hypothetical protein